MNHFNSCKDVCDDFGVSILLSPQVNPNRIAEAFTVKSFSDPLSLSSGKDGADDTGGYIFHNDEFWDDDFELDIDPSTLYDEDEDELDDAMSEKTLPSDEGVTDDAMIQITKDVSH